MRLYCHFSTEEERQDYIANGFGSRCGLVPVLLDGQHGYQPVYFQAVLLTDNGEPGEIFTLTPGRQTMRRGAVLAIDVPDAELAGREITERAPPGRWWAMPVGVVDAAMGVTSRN